MRRRIAAVLVFALCLAVGGSVFAQPRGNFQPPPPPDINELKEELSLTDDQAEQLEALFKKQADSRSSGEGRRGGGFRQAMEEMEAVLSEEQMEKYREYTARKLVERRVAMIDEQVELTDDQEKKLTDILMKQSEESSKLMQQMREADREDRRAMMETFREMRRKSQEEIEKVLTDEQREKYNDRSRNSNRPRRRDR